jgi:hypothetical protein
MPKILRPIFDSFGRFFGLDPVKSPHFSRKLAVGEAAM